jgi:hypothetical protein
MGTTSGSGRAAALRKAELAAARRAVAFREREKRVREMLTDYFHSADRAEKVRADAEAKAARIRRDADAKIARVREQAEAATAGLEEQARAALRRMLEAGESREAVAEATGLSLAQVRDAQRTASETADAAGSGKLTAASGIPGAPVD